MKFKSSKEGKGRERERETYKVMIERGGELEHSAWSVDGLVVSDLC